MANEEIGVSIEVDSNGDIVTEEDEFGNISFKLTEGVDEVSQALRLRLGQVRLEDLLHPNDGLQVERLVGPVTTEYVIGQISQEIAKDPRVLRVTTFELDFNRETRVLSLAANVLLKDGNAVDLTTDLGI